MPEISNKKIGEILVENGLITFFTASGGLGRTKGKRREIRRYPGKKGWISREEFQHWLTTQTGIAVFNLSNYLVDPG